jgi:hypothetical protein
MKEKKMEEREMNEREKRCNHFASEKQFPY